jgi:predicted alpha/beta superfamily hydrolase
MTTTPQSDPAAAIANEQPLALFGSTQFDMASANTGRTYRIFVFKPTSAPPPSGYSLVLVTDGNFAFPIAAATNAFLGIRGETALIVGVGYPVENSAGGEILRLRNRDFTPPTPLSAIWSAQGQPPPSADDYGGSEGFYRFLTEELRPAIARAYPIDASRETLYGDSLGGLFVLGVLFTYPEAYRSFVAASPSIWWNDRAVLADEAEFVRRVESREIAPRVPITIGANEQDAPVTPPPGMTLADAEERIRRARMVDNAAELAERLRQVDGGPGYAARFQLFESEDHLTAVAPSINRALVFALES